jgi:hypothetical protein
MRFLLCMVPHSWFLIHAILIVHGSWFSVLIKIMLHEFGLVCNQDAQQDNHQ